MRCTCSRASHIRKKCFSEKMSKVANGGPDSGRRPVARSRLRYMPTVVTKTIYTVCEHCQMLIRVVMSPPKDVRQVLFLTKTDAATSSTASDMLGNVVTGRRRQTETGRHTQSALTQRTKEGGGKQFTHKHAQ